MAEKDNGNIGAGLITLVIHTEERAMRLKEILEYHDIPVTLEKVEVAEPAIVGNPIKIRIPLESLTLGLKILESGEESAEPLALIKMTGVGNTLLIPVDFSPMSDVSLKLGFYLAEKFDVEPMLLHCYSGPPLLSSEFMTPDPAVSGAPDEDLELEAIEADDMRKQASTQLSKLKKKVKLEQLEGTLPDIHFTTSLLEGIPEQVIREFCKANNPFMVVMATRDCNKKGSDLVGSVTAEVIDSCRVPVFAVPANYTMPTLEKTTKIALFCTFSGFDILVVRWLMRSFDYPAWEFNLIPGSDRPITRVDKKLDELKDYLSRMYPTATFHTHMTERGKFDDSIKRIFEKQEIQLIIVPNKKSSALSRFFRPTLAHRILYEKDIPLLVLPV